MRTTDSILNDIRQLVKDEVVYWQKSEEAASVRDDLDTCKKALAKQEDALQRLQRLQRLIG